MKNTLIILIISFSCFGCKKNQENNKSSNQNIQSLNYNGIDREYLTYIPSNYSSSLAVPLVLNFHGFGGNSSEHSSYVSMEALAEKENFILVYPQGTLMDNYSHWNPSLPSSTNKSSADDLGFVEYLIDELSRNYNIDSKRIYACGFSNGGMMSFGLANHKSNLIAAVASISGAMLETEIKPSHPMPVLIIHGTSDGVIPYNGDSYYESVEKTLNYWKDFNNIDSLTNSNSNVTNGISIQYDSYESGDKRVSVDHYKINQGGHEWFDINYEGNNTNDLVWSFFSKYNIDGLID